MEAVLLRVFGVVQGVGFRPFVYRIAAANGLSGFVRNSGTDVEILVEGERVREFIGALKTAKPPIVIERMEKKTVGLQGLSDFKIIESDSANAQSPIPLDSAVCPDCMQELRSENNRRFNYEFTNCVSCGPRFSLLRRPPFDRKNTSLGTFAQCAECGREYVDPGDRRFHAQTNCCNSCGPHYFLYHRENLLAGDPIKKTAQLLTEGSAVVVKGWGGMHVAVDATNDRAVRDLRKKLLRPSQPFAVMVRDIVQAKRCGRIGREEEEQLLSPARPIVVVDKKRFLAPAVSNLHNIGIMLPHSALQVLLFQQIDFPLVFTSANISGLPMEIDNDNVRKLPFNHFLLHNLNIENRIDDSVVRIVGPQPVLLRRSRGIAPLPISVYSGRVPSLSASSVLAFGAELQNTACLLSGGNAFLTQHIGNCTSMEVVGFLEAAVERSLGWRGVKPDFVACDLHPKFLTTRLAQEYSQRHKAELVPVQHHQAHMYGVMAEHSLEKAVGIVCDGVGYAKKGVSWGGEVFYSDGLSFERVGHLKEVLMPGGDLSAIDPRRMLAGFLSEAVGKKELKGLLSGIFGAHEIRPVLHQLSDPPKTSSAGRFLDAVSALLGVCTRRTYEGEPAMRLESFAFGVRKHKRLKYPIKNNVVDTPAIIGQFARSFGKDPSRANARALAYAAEEALACSLFEIALSASKEYGCRDLVVCGGVFYNGHISETIASLCKKHGLGLYRNVLVPCGDGGLSFGQACLAGRIAGS